MKGKTILLIMPYGSVGGMERLALSFYKYYKNSGYEVKALKFISLENDIINFNQDELYFSNKDFYEMSSFERLQFYLGAPLKIRKIIKDLDVSHSISFGDMANLFSSLTFTNEFKIGSIHALKSVELQGNSFFNKLTKIGYRTSYKNLNKLVCISKAIKDDLIKNCGYKFSNMEIIYNPHDIEHIQKLAEESLTDPFEKNIITQNTILFLGRMSIQKAPWHLIKAFKLLMENGKTKANLVFIGDGNKEVTKHVTTLIDKFNLSDKVFFLGRKDNPYKYISKAGLLALTSYYEGTPNVIVESIAIGIPIVSTNCTKGIEELMSLKEVMESNDNITVESGIITPNMFKGKLEIPNNDSFISEEKQFSEALNQVLNNADFKENLLLNQRQLLEKFDIQSVSKKYLKIN
ncbi:glycosyltransferase [Gaetbulibacter aestuarii]|uniref:Glycosyltransferase n=1 Tax=Gaetbulibacter aestuarii TaxID=1502358 RepID=A0ABW7N3F6_9FLAO